MNAGLHLGAAWSQIGLRLRLETGAGSQTTDAQLVNLSRGGALVVAESPLPCEQPVWLRIERPVKTDWARAVTVRIGRNREIALRFPAGCPDDLLVAGTIGINILLSFFAENESGSHGDLEM